jgi:D-aminoacyl-tRNA deacylase
LHAPGNFRNADLGGKAFHIAKTSAFVLKFLFKALKKNKDNESSLNDYALSLEATHHGPDIEIPCCFIEVGSTEKEWNDPVACLAIAKTIYELNNFKESKELIPSIAIGGPHYCPNFNEIQLNSNYAISHVIANYNFPITENIINEAEKKTTEQIKEIIIDWKGCVNSKERTNLISILDKLGLKYIRSDKIDKTRKDL